MAAAPGALLSAVTDKRKNEFVFTAVLHVLIYAYMELAAIVIVRPGTQLVHVTAVIPQNTLHGFGIPSAGGLDHREGQKLNALVVRVIHPRLTSFRHQRL